MEVSFSVKLFPILSFPGWPSRADHMDALGASELHFKQFHHLILYFPVYQSLNSPIIIIILGCFAAGGRPSAGWPA